MIQNFNFKLDENNFKFSNKKTDKICNFLLLSASDPHDYVKELIVDFDKISLENILLVVSSLKKEYLLENEVINCLINYVLTKNNYRLEPNYIFKIASTLQQKNNFKNAFLHLREAYLKNKKNNKLFFINTL
jgi:replication initiation and membrane attachment protein DnaB